jgi:hypothetical protein
MIFLKFCGILRSICLAWLRAPWGQGTPWMSLYVLVGGLWAYFVHANVGLRFGFLEKDLASPAFHHWHHSNELPESIDKNYAAIFPFIDRLFGTFYLPSRRWTSPCLRCRRGPGSDALPAPPPPCGQIQHSGLTHFRSFQLCGLSRVACHCSALSGAFAFLLAM